MPDDFNEVQTVLHTPPGGRTTVRRRPRVAWHDTGGAHEITIERLTLVGSSPSADLVVANPTVSRLHAELEPRPDGLWIRDLASRNGTYVDGLQVSGARVADGARIDLGSAVLTVNPTSVDREVELWPEPHFGPVLGGSIAMRELFATLARVAATDSTVLVLGETGTGKELVARAVHDASPRAPGPFVVVDCAALPEQLLESELFGHARGAFTGALAAHTGALEAAGGGTLFLDEIGELPLTMQPKLLRALESRTIRRLGETSHRAIDVRFVSATHRDLRAMVAAGAFREDLYFRLAVLPVTIPPLRERMDDVALLLDHFMPTAPAATRSGLLKELLDRPWLGNVRELRNFVERAAALGTKQALAMTPSGRPPPPVTGAAASEGDGEAVARAFELPYREFRDALEREYVRRLLARHGGNVTAAAQAAGIDRTYIHRLVRKHQP